MSGLKDVLRLAGAYIAFLIGAGFATGQETLQFFAAFGGQGLLGAAIVFVGGAYTAVTFFLAGRRHGLRNSDDIFRHYAGPYLGPAFGWYAVVVAFSLYVVMLSGAGAVLQQTVALSPAIGAAVMAVAVMLTLVLGLRELVDVIGSLGPVLVVLIVIIAGTAVLQAPVPDLAAGAPGATTVGLRAASSWWVSALLYLALLQPPMAAFLPPLGAAARDERTVVWAGVLGPLLFAVTLALCTLAMLGGLPEPSREMIPMLALAQRVTPRIAAIFPWVIVAGVFTTAAPMLWITAVRFADDGSRRYRMLVLLLGAAGYVTSVALPFDRLLNLIFPTIGWSGSALVACVLWKQARSLRAGG